MLAERSSPPWRLAAIVAGGLGLISLISLVMTAIPIAKPAPVEITIIQPTPAAPTESCPTDVRARAHVPADATVVCLPYDGDYFVTAYYHTTEWWERFGVISVDGTREVVPLVDRPSHQQ